QHGVAQKLSPRMNKREERALSAEVAGEASERAERTEVSEESEATSSGYSSWNSIPRWRCNSARSVADHAAESVGGLKIGNALRAVLDAVSKWISSTG
ncbi:hypothetical protein CKK21_26220, partial [Enterobacter cloacae]